MKLAEEFSHIDNEYLYNLNKMMFAQFSPFLEGLKQEELSALHSYKSMGYTQINTYLRNKKLPPIDFYKFTNKVAQNMFEKRKEWKKYNSDYDIRQEIAQVYVDMSNKTLLDIAHIDNVFAKVPKSKFRAPLFRGVDVKDDFLTSKSVGDTHTFDDFLSTSLSPSTAWRFQKCGTTPCCIFIFRTSRVLPMLPLHWGNNFDKITMTDEHEILLPRGTTWKIEKKYKSSISFNHAITCEYDKIQASKAQPVQVYEFSFVSHPKPKRIEPLTYEPYNLNIVSDE